VRDLFPFLVSGVVAGSLYGLAGIGLVLTYRTSGVFNLAHGAIAAGAAYLFSQLHHDQGVPWPLALGIVVLVFATVVGILLDVVTRVLTDAPDVLAVVATVGLMLGVEGLIYDRYGLDTRRFPQFLPESGFRVEGVQISWAQVITAGLAIAASLLLFAFLQRHRLGIAMRAVVDNPALASLSGERVVSVRRWSWCLSSAVAAVAGILLAPTINLDVHLLTLLVVQAFGACAIGRFASLPWTFAGGLVVGLLASLLTRYVTSGALGGLAPSAPFLVLIVVLLVVPVRLLPRGAAERRELTVSSWSPTRRQRTALLGVGLAVVLVLPEVAGTRLPVWTTAAGYVVVFASLALLTWASGQLSLCHAAFLAVGVTTMAGLTDRGVPWLPSLLLSGLAAVPVGALVAVPAIRLSGLYLGLVTLGFGILMQNVVFRTEAMFGDGLTATVPRPSLGPIDGTDDRTLFYLVVAIAALCCVALTAMWRGRIGRTLRALAEAPAMLATQGLEVTVTRLLVLCTATFFAGVGGVLIVVQPGTAGGSAYGPIQSLVLVAVLAVGGTSRVRSPLVAALLLAVVPGYVSDFGFEQQLLVFGAAALAAATFQARRSELRAWLGRAASTSKGRRAHGPALPPWRASGVTGR
jgi:branched-subunit amino acid ABC-type transport system permease component